MELLFCDICKKKITHQESLMLAIYNNWWGEGRGAKQTYAIDLCGKCTDVIKKDLEGKIKKVKSKVPIKANQEA